MLTKIDDILSRMRVAADLKNDSELAKVLGITPQAISKAKKSGRIPPDLIIKFALALQLSVDWILTGEGAMRRTLPCEEDAPAPTLTPRTATLINNFEALDEEDKRAFERLVLTVAQSKKKMKKVG